MLASVLGLDFGICVDLENDIPHRLEIGCAQYLMVADKFSKRGLHTSTCRIADIEFKNGYL